MIGRGPARGARRAVLVMDKGCRACQSSSSAPGRGHLPAQQSLQIRPLLKSSPPASDMHAPLPGGPGETSTSLSSVGKINACEPQGSRKWLPSCSSKRSNILHDLSFSSSAHLPLRLSPFLPLFPISPPFSYFSPFPQLSPLSPPPPRQLWAGHCPPGARATQAGLALQSSL